MSILTHNTDDIKTTIGPEWAGQLLQTPLDLLDGPTLDTIADWLAESDEAPRYVVQPKHSAVLDRVLFHVIDRAEDRLIRWAFTRAEAEGVAEDLNAEDYEPLLIGGLPWFEVGYGVPAWDGPRYSPTTL